MLKDMDLGYRATAVEKGTALVETNKAFLTVFISSLYVLII